jgi:F-type H+-transporting ATPase subunit gamma
MNDAVDTLFAFVGEYLFVSLYRACAESLASENASRLAAMQGADKNIEELFDVISGFEALSKN